MLEMEQDRVLGNLVRAIGLIESCPEFSALIPEVRVNLAYAIAGATEPRQVAAVEGRITRVGVYPRAAGMPAFGASDHMARLLVQTMRREPGLRAGINFAYSEELEAGLKMLGYAPVKIDRAQEPAVNIRPERTSMPWKIGRLVEITGGIPRLFYESAAPGKEPLFVLLGEDAAGVAAEACSIARRLAAAIPGR